MNKIVILCGISGSGKSTYANELWASDPTKYVIVSRDKIRELLFGYNESNVNTYYESPLLNTLENTISKYQESLIDKALQENVNVIIDNTNLKIKYIREFYSRFNANFEFKFFDISKEEAIARNSNRVRKVSSDIISKQYESYCNLKKNFKINEFLPKLFIPINNDINKPQCIVVDIDGTLAHMKDRYAFDWDKVGNDDPDSAVIQAVRILSSHYTIIICSGRDEICKKETELWLSTFGVPYEHIYMRKNKDNRSDYIIKEEFWREITNTYYIEFMLDDRQSVVNKARSLGFKVFQVEPGMF